jgi:uncharacterized protein YgiM (DUF1202 family)
MALGAAALAVQVYGLGTAPAEPTFASARPVAERTQPSFIAYRPAPDATVEWRTYAPTPRLAARLAATEPAPAEPVLPRFRVVADGLNVRQAPDKGAVSITVLRQGAEVMVRERGEGWYRVQFAPGETGWVAERFLEPVPIEVAAAE